MFFCPDESGDKEYGWVQMDMLHQIGDKKLENVAVVKLCASEMYSLYLADHIVSENEMDKRYIIDLKIRPYFEKKILSEITVADVRAWQNELLMYKWIRL